ncbi:MAG: response regulator, partial [Candidatus Rokubacteria bacterium]|nr:response regulator [Candidatus Rokubacteria bacterium]
RARRLRALADLNRLVSASLELDRVLVAIAKAAASLFDSAICTFWLVNEEARVLDLCALSNDEFDEFHTRRLAFGQSGAGRVAETRRPLIVDEVATDDNFANKDWWASHGLRSFFGIPVMLGKTMLAVLALGRGEPFRLDTDDQELLDTLASHAAAAIRNARIYEDSLRRGHNLEILTGVTRAVTEFLEIDQILPAITEAALRLFPGGFCRVWIVEGEMLRLRAEAGPPGTPPAERREMALGDGMAGVVCMSGTPLTVDDVLADGRAADRVWREAQGVKSAAVLPLMAGERSIGAFSLFTCEDHVFTLDEVSVLQAFAEHAAVALEKARLFQDVEERRRQTEGLYEMSRAMQKRMDVEYRAETFITFARDVLGFDRINAFLASDDGRELVLVAGTDHDGRRIPLTADAGAFEASFRSRETLVVADDDALRALPPVRPEILAHPVARTRRFVIVPLLFQGRMLGLVIADNKPSRRPFTRRGVAQLELFSQQLASSITNARLFAEIREQQTRLEQIFSSTSDGILVLDLDGRIVALNRQGGSLLSLVPDAVLGRPFAELVGSLGEAVDWEAPGSAAFRALAGRPGSAAGDGEEEGDLDVALPRRRTLRWQRRPTNDAEGATVGSTITLRDVTHEREVDRMKTEFVSMVSHELRTPLTSIKGSLHLLLSEPALASDETNRQLVEISLSNTDRLIRLINDILDISKIEAGRIELQPAPHAVSEWVGAAVAGITGFAELRQIRVETHLAPDLPIVSVDSDRMVQVVTNLLSNAIKFSPEGSRVVVDADVHAAEIRVRVKDEGRGIAAADIPKLFQKFRQLDSRSVREVGGTGLGLAICRGIVEEHGGRVWVESDVGAGATFIVALPVATGARLPTPPGASLTTAPAIGSALILVVDDESDVRRTLRRYLEREGYAVIEAARGLDAVEMAARHRPDLITMDVLLPDIDGFEAIRLIRERPTVRDVPVVVVSAASGADGQLEPAVSGHLRKPVEAAALIDAVKSALGDRRRAVDTTVLIVDDDADIRTVLGRILREAGYAVVAAADGDEALAAVTASRPDLVLLDIKMPRMSGFEVLRRLRAAAATHDLPVIVLTASEGQGGRDRALGLGATEYLRKPFSTDALLAEIRERLAEPRGSPR